MDYQNLRTIRNIELLLPIRRINRQGTGWLQVFPDDDPSGGSIQASDFDPPLLSCVNPVDIFSHPVHCYPFWISQPVLYNWLQSTAIQECPADSLWKHKPKLMNMIMYTQSVNSYNYPVQLVLIFLIYMYIDRCLGSCKNKNFRKFCFITRGYRR